MNNDEHQRSLTATGLTPFGSEAVARFLRPLTESRLLTDSEFCDALDFRELTSRAPVEAAKLEEASAAAE